MDRGKLLGVASGMGLFLILLGFFFFHNSDFDQYLIHSVDANIPAEKLIPEINAQRIKEEKKAQKNLASHVMKADYWNKIEIGCDDDFLYYKKHYNEQMKVIGEYEDLRIRYVTKKVTREYFVSKIPDFKNKIDN